MEKLAAVAGCTALLKACADYAGVMAQQGITFVEVEYHTYNSKPMDSVEYVPELKARLGLWHCNTAGGFLSVRCLSAPGAVSSLGEDSTAIRLSAAKEGNVISWKDFETLAHYGLPTAPAPAGPLDWEEFEWGFGELTLGCVMGLGGRDRQYQYRIMLPHSPKAWELLRDFLAFEHSKFGSLTRGQWRGSLGRGQADEVSLVAKVQGFGLTARMALQNSERMLTANYVEFKPQEEGCCSVTLYAESGCKLPTLLAVADKLAAALANAPSPHPAPAAAATQAAAAPAQALLLSLRIQRPSAATLAVLFSMLERVGYDAQTGSLYVIGGHSKVAAVLQALEQRQGAAARPPPDALASIFEYRSELVSEAEAGGLLPQLE